MLYRIFAYIGVCSVTASMLFGFRHDPAAPALNYAIVVLLYAGFIAPHLVMTMSRYKLHVWGTPTSTLRERQVYVSVTILSWWLVYAVHPPTPGFQFELPAWATYAGIMGFLVGHILSNEGITLAALDGMFGVPGSAMNYSHGADSPLFTDGPYARVRHPMYLAMTVMAAASMVIHPTAAQLLWSCLIVGTFVASIPVEEAQMLAIRGDEYRQYMLRTPYRIFPGLY